MATPQAADQSPVLRNDHDGVATFTLNRPAQYNALSSALLITLPAALDAIATGKKVFYEQPDAGLEQAYALATETMVCNMLAADAAEGINAFMQKRPPQWRGH